MKSNAQSFGATNKAIGSGAFADAKTLGATVRPKLVALQGFWIEKKRDDALGIVKDALTKINQLDKMLSAPTVDQMAAQAAAKEVQRRQVWRVPQALSRRRRPDGLPIQGRGDVDPFGKFLLISRTSVSVVTVCELHTTDHRGKYP